jgi:hypothetical protein
VFIIPDTRAIVTKRGDFGKFNFDPFWLIKTLISAIMGLSHENVFGFREIFSFHTFILNGY